MSAKLSIYNYLDYRQYLQDYYRLQKESNASFSYTTWAHQAGIKSRSFLRMVVTGLRPLTEKMLPILASSLGLSSQEERYFATLVGFNLTSDIAKREQLFKELKSFRNTNTRIHDSYNYLSNHWCPKIHLLLTLEDQDRSCQAIASKFKLSTTQVKQILEALERLELASCNQDGQWSAEDANFYIPDDLNNIAIQSFHTQGLECAKEAVSSDSNQRQYQAVFVALSPQEYRTLSDQIDSVTTRILNQFSQTKGEGRRLYQFNSALIPLSPVLMNDKKEIPKKESSQEETPGAFL